VSETVRGSAQDANLHVCLRHACGCCFWQPCGGFRQQICCDVARCVHNCVIIFLPRSYEDVYGDPGTPLARRTKAGTYILAKVRLDVCMRLCVVCLLWARLGCLAAAGHMFFAVATVSRL
jgi:hypothetical protein